MWQKYAQEYKGLIENSERDSMFLREEGLKPNILDLIGDCKNATILDAGTGTSWLFESVRPKSAYACDIVVPAKSPENVNFSQQSVESLTYEDNTFDIVVASLLLMFCERLDAVCTELFRVCRSSGHLVVALTHPYFYRTGEVTASGDFLLTQDLSRPFEMTVKIGGKVGPLPYYYRPFPEYLNQLIKAGWNIVEVRDWFVNTARHKELVAAGMKSEIRRSGHVPLYSFIKCEKP